MRNLVAAIALATLAACAGVYTDGSTPINGPDGGGTGTPGNPDGGDGGSDAGVDAGPDAGCVALSLDSVGVVDSCVSSVQQNGTATGFVEDAGHGCADHYTATTLPTTYSGDARA